MGLSTLSEALPVFLPSFEALKDRRSARKRLGEPGLLPVFTACADGCAEAESVWKQPEEGCGRRQMVDGS